MPKFTLTIDREVTQIDRLVRVVEAPDMETAVAMGEAAANAFNSDCPDDYEKAAEADYCDDWYVEKAELAPDDAEVDGLPEGDDDD